MSSRKIWLPRIIQEKKTGEIFYTYATQDTGFLIDVAEKDMTMDDMCDFMISFISAQITRMKEHAKLMKCKLTFDLDTPEDKIDNSLALYVALEEVNDVNFRQFTEEDIEDNNN